MTATIAFLVAAEAVTTSVNFCDTC